MNPLSTIKDFASDSDSKTGADRVSPSVDNKSYLAVLESLAGNNEWLADKSLVRRIISRLEVIEPQTAEVCEKVANVYRKIINYNQDPTAFNTVELRISGEHSVLIPKKLLMVASDLLKGHDAGAVVDLSGKASEVTLAYLVAYLFNGKTDFITDQNAMEILLLAKKFGMKELSMKCVEQLLDPKSRAEEGIKERSISPEERELWDLLREAKENGITISKPKAGIVYVTMQYSSQTKPWESLKKLQSFASIKNLQLTEMQNGDHLLDFTNFNPNLVRLDLGDCTGLVDETYLMQLGNRTPHLESLSMRHASIKAIPETISHRLKELDCAHCRNLKTLDIPLAKTLNCFKCYALTTVNAPVAETLDCGKCFFLATLNAPVAKTIDCGGCALKTLDAPLVETLDCSECPVLRSLNAPAATTLNCNACHALTTIDAPKAQIVYCCACDTLKTLKAPLATEVNCLMSGALTTIDAPEAKSLDCTLCGALKTINAPKAETLKCPLCEALTTINAPKAKKVDCVGCPTLTTLNTPVATELNCIRCGALKTIDVPKAKKVDCSDCVKLRTLNAPVAKIVSCPNCSRLETMNVPLAETLDWKNCPALTSINILPTAKFL